MKQIKRIMALTFSIILCLTMSITVFAENGATKSHTITIKNKDEVGTHTYEAYQVFAGDVAVNEEHEKVLSNITWGTGVNGDAVLEDVKTDTATFGPDAANVKTAADVAALLGDGHDTPKAKKFAEIVGEHLTSTVAGTSTKTDRHQYTITVTGDGYYFVKDKASTVPDDPNTADPHQGDAETRYILQVVGDVEVDAKSSIVESKKKVQDINDSTDIAVGDLVDSADYDIGDTIPYTLTFKLPANYADYKTYAVNFFDDMSAGLTYNNDAKIYYGAADTTGEDITFTADSSKTTRYTGGTVYKASVADLKTAAPSPLQAGGVITVKYTVTLNKNAEIGANGNPNKYQVEFSDNPNGDGTGTTPWDMNIVFTYDIEVDKVTGTGDNEKALKGAAFALYKLYTTEALTLAGKTAVTEIKYDNGTKTFDIGEDNWVLVEQKTARDASEFIFSGVDDGTYLLVETTTPAGYNSIEPSKFVVQPTHTDGDAPKLTGITGTDKGLAPIELTPKTKSASDDTITGLKTKILNNEGSVLPSTGGIGTTVFYIIGSALVLGAGVLLATKKKAAN